MAEDIGGEATPQTRREWSRRDLGKVAAFALFAGGYYYVTGRSPQSSPSNPNVLDPNSKLAALAAASEGKSIVGNAVGNFPERALRLAQEATNLIVVTYSGTDVASVGTAWKAQLGEQFDENEITLATAGHVLTDHGRHSLANIATVWIGHPCSRDSFTPLDPGTLRMTLAPRANQSDAANDAGVVRIPKHAAPAQLAAAPALRLAGSGENMTGGHLLVTGVPAVFVTQFTSLGIETTPLYAQVMSLKRSNDVPSDCVGLHGLSGDGISGASAIGPNGEVFGMVVDYVTRDPYTTVAAPLDALRQLA